MNSFIQVLMLLVFPYLLWHAVTWMMQSPWETNWLFWQREIAWENKNIKLLLLVVVNWTWGPSVCQQPVVGSSRDPYFCVQKICNMEKFTVAWRLFSGDVVYTPYMVLHFKFFTWLVKHFVVALLPIKHIHWELPSIKKGSNANIITLHVWQP